MGTKTVKRSAVVPEPFTAPSARPLFSSVVRGTSSSKISFRGGDSAEADTIAHKTRSLTPAEKDLKIQRFKSYTFD